MESKTLNETLEEIEKRADAATPGPCLDDEDACQVCGSMVDVDGCKDAWREDAICDRCIGMFGRESRDIHVPKLLAMLRLAIEQRDTAYTCSWDKDLGSMIADDDLALLAVGRGENG